MDEIKKAKIEQELNEKRERRTLYIEREKAMLKGAAQSYGVGSRNRTQFNTDLSQIRAAIKELDDEIEELEGSLAGRPKRKRVGLVFQDRW